MNHTIQNVSSVTARCRRFTQFLTSNSKVQGSIRLIRGTRNAVLTSTFTDVLPGFGTLTARAFKGSERAATRIARSVAIVIGIGLSMQSTAIGVGSIDAYHDLHSLADYQLTDRQYACHSEIVHRESSNRIDAVNGSHYGYYQIRNRLLIDSPYDYQFYFYWKYVQHRYGTTKYDEPDYCKALHHLRTKGWQ